MSTATASKPASEEAAPPAGKSKKKLLIVGLLVVVLGGAGYWFFLKPSGEPKEPEPGEVVTLEPIQLNLAGGRYLKIGIALQLTAEAAEAEGSKALDATIAKFSGLPLSELNDPKQRQELKKELEEELIEQYHGEVMGVYFVDFVTQ